MADLEDDWEALNRPSKVQKAIRRTQEASMSFLEFLFGWLGRTWIGFWRQFRDLENWFTLAVVIAMAGLFTLAYLSFKSDGRIDYCYVMHDGTPTLMGHRPWRNDVRLRVLKDSETVELLYATAKELGCPFP